MSALSDFALLVLWALQQLPVPAAVAALACALAWVWSTKNAISEAQAGVDAAVSAIRSIAPESRKSLVRALVLQVGSVFLGILVAAMLDAARVDGGVDPALTTIALFALPSYLLVANLLAITGGELGPSLWSLVVPIVAASAIIYGVHLTTDDRQVHPVQFLSILAYWLVPSAAWALVTFKGAPALATLSTIRRA